MLGMVIGASQDSVHALNIAKNLGISTIAVDGNASADGLQHSEISIHKDISDEEAIIQLARENNVDFVIPTPIGRYLTTIGAVNDALNLRGVWKSSAISCTDKWKFHALFKDTKFRSIKSSLITSFDDVSKIKISDFTSVIVKPRFGSGSRNVRMFDKHSDVENFLDDIFNNCAEDYIVEEYVEGSEFGIDAAIIDGNVHLIMVREKKVTEIPIRQAVASISCPRDFYDFDIESIVVEFLNTAKNLLNLNDCLINADAIIKKDSLFCIEFSARPSGHNLYNCFVKHCTGIDMVEEILKCFSGKQYNFTPRNVERFSCIHFFDLPSGVVQTLPDWDDLVKSNTVTSYVCNMKQGDIISPTVDGKSIMGRGYFIVDGISRNDIENKINTVLIAVAERK